MIDKNKNYDDITVYANPDYNLLGTKSIIYSDKVLFCPELLDEDCFVYYSKYVHDKKNIRETYRKVLDYTISFSFLSMLIYSLACSNNRFENGFLALGNWIPKSIITSEPGQVTTDSNGNNIYWFKYSTVNFVNRDSDWLTGLVMSDYLNVVEISRTKMYSYLVLDENDKLHTKIKKISQPSFYRPTEKTWKLVEKVRNGEMTFVTIEREKIWKLFYDKIRPLSRKSKGNASYKITAKDFNKETLKKYRGYRKKGEIIPYSTLNAGTMSNSVENSVPISYVEICIRSLFDDEEGITFQSISMNLDGFYDMPREKCDFDENDLYDATTYFEIDPEILINFLANKSLTSSYSPHILYQVYEILAKCKEYKGRYYYSIDYLRRKNGRYYGIKNYIQNMPKSLRKIVLSKYKSVDMNCGVYSLLLSIAKKLKYRGDTTEIEKMVSNRKEYRESLVDDELGITYSDVKDKLTIISFGCRMNTDRMLISSEYELLNVPDDSYVPYHTSLYKDEIPERKFNISKWCSKPEVVELHKEIEKLGNFLIRKYIIKRANGTNMLVNSLGNVIEINRKTRHTFGEKLAFIYQSEESVLLQSIVDNFKVGRRKLKNIKGGIGLLLHDAIYVHNNIIKRYENIADTLSEYVKNTFDYEIKYETE